MFYREVPCEWCGDSKLTLLVETPEYKNEVKIERFSYLCLDCITDTHQEAIEHLKSITLVKG